MKTEYDFSKAKRGPVKAATGKTRITIYLDDDVLAHFRDTATVEGLGYQTVINRVLRAAMHPAPAAMGHALPDDASSLLIEIKNTLNEVKRRLPAPMPAPGALYAGMGEVLLRQPGYAIFREGGIDAPVAGGFYPSTPLDVVKPAPAKKKASKLGFSTPRGGARR